MKKISTYLLPLSLLGPLACGQALAAAPSVSSAVLDATTGALVVTGSNFGTKSTAAPLKTIFMANNTTGDDYLDAGFDYLSGNWTTRTTENYVDMTDGIGGGSWFTRTPGDYYGFQHLGNELPAGNTQIYTAMWIKMEKVGTSGSGAWGQLKGIRTGSSTDGDPADKYHGPNFSYSGMWYDVSGDGISPGNLVGFVHKPEEYAAYDYMSWSEPNLNDREWHFVEVYSYWAASGANSIHQAWVDNQMAFDWTGIDMETAGEFRFVTWLPGLTNDFINATYDIRLSHLYADNTRARVYLCNSSTAAGCTQKFLVAPSAWSGTSITTEGVNIPSGYNWVYVVNAAGEVNSSGYEFTITGCD